MSIVLHSMLLVLSIFALVVAAIQGNTVNCAIATAFCLCFALQIIFYGIALHETNREYAMEVDRLLKEVDQLLKEVNEISKKNMEDLKNCVLNSIENQKNDNLSSNFNQKTLEKTKNNQKNNKNNQKQTKINKK